MTANNISSSTQIYTQTTTTPLIDTPTPTFSPYAPHQNAPTTIPHSVSIISSNGSTLHPFLDRIASFLQNNRLSKPQKAELISSAQQRPQGEDLKNWVPLIQALILDDQISSDIAMNAIDLGKKAEHAGIVEALSRRLGLAILQELPSAAKNGNLQEVQHLLNQCGRDCLDKWAQENAIAEAAKNGHVEIVELLMKDFPLNDIQWATTYSLLVFAAKNGHTKTIEFLLSKNAKIDKWNAEPAIVIAAGNGHAEILKLLLSQNLEIDQVCAFESFQAAMKNGNAKLVELLLSKFQEMDKLEPAASDILRFAAKNGHVEIVELLLKNCKIDEIYLSDAVEIAQKNNHLEVVEFLKKGNIEDLLDVLFSRKVSII